MLGAGGHKSYRVYAPKIHRTVRHLVFATFFWRFVGLRSRKLPQKDAISKEFERDGEKKQVISTTRSSNSMKNSIFFYKIHLKLCTPVYNMTWSTFGVDERHTHVNSSGQKFEWHRKRRADDAGIKWAPFWHLILAIFGTLDNRF